MTLANFVALYLGLLGKIKAADDKVGAFMEATEVLLETFQNEGLCMHFELASYSAEETAAEDAPMGSLDITWPEMEPADINRVTWHLRADAASQFEGTRAYALDEHVDYVSLFGAVCRFLMTYALEAPPDEAES